MVGRRRLVVLEVLVLFACAACSVERSGLAEMFDSDLGVVDTDLGARDAGSMTVDDGVPSDFGALDLGAPDLGPPDLGCAVNGCGSPSVCLVGGECGDCVPSDTVCCPSCGSGQTCTAGACVTSGGSCGSVGDPCCLSLSPCMGHAGCDLFGGTCVHCGDSGEGCCGGITCYGGTRCGIDSTFSFVCS